MRCDLHVHSRHSGELGLRLLGAAARECYSHPLDVYEVARARGMHLVTLTDHDSIDGALQLVARYADAFVSEEVTCTVAGGREVHLGVFGMNERQHARICVLRADAEALFAYLAEEDLPACFNHPFSALTGARETIDLLRMFASVQLVEVRNGLLPPAVNRCAEAAARVTHLPGIGGSDAHTLTSVARAYTEVSGARDKHEFLAGLRRGLTIPRGRSGGYTRLAGDVARLVASACLEAAHVAPARLPVALLALPLLPIVPMVTGMLALRDVLFARRHLGVLLGGKAGAPRLRPPSAGSLLPQLRAGAAR